MPFDKTIRRLDDMISNLEAELGVSPSSVDPDDPWGSQNLGKSKSVYKKNCATPTCSYRLTIPFEQRCPICYFKDKKAIPNAFELLPVDAILANLPKRDAGQSSGEGSSSGEGKKGGKKAQEKPAGDNKEQKPAAAAPAKGKGKGKAEEPEWDSASLGDPWEQFHIQVSEIVSIQNHPSADALFLIEINSGEEKPRQLCAGLRKFYTADKLNGKRVCTVMNLKPIKLRGVLSTAMILAGNDGPDTVRILEPPTDSAPGDRVYLKDKEPTTATKEVSNSKAWPAVVDKLKVQGGLATYDGIPLVTSKGVVTVPDLPDGSGIH